MCVFCSRLSKFLHVENHKIKRAEALEIIVLEVCEEKEREREREGGGGGREREVG